MRATFSAPTLERDITVALSALLTPAQQSAAAADFARVKLGEAQDTNRRATGRVPLHETFVDGRAEAPLESVKTNGGTIVFKFSLVDNTATWIMDQLIRVAPVKTGRFKRSFVMLADGVQVDPGTELKGVSRYLFANTQPYSRKIERGLSSQAPNGVFQAVASLAQAKFGKTVRVRFTYVTLLSAIDVSLSGGERRKADRAARTPAVTVEFN